MLLNLDIEFSPLTICFLLFLLLLFFRSFFARRSRCNEALRYAIQLIVWLCNNFFIFKHLILIIPSFG